MRSESPLSGCLLVAGALAAICVLGVPARAQPAPPSSGTQSHFVQSGRTSNPDIAPAVEDLLAEHERLTGEEIRIVTLTTPPPNELAAHTHALIQTLGIGARSSGRGVLVVLDTLSHQAAIEAAFGISERLPAPTLQSMANDVARPFLKQDAVGEAALAVSMALLRELDSPLIESGRWQNAVALVPRAEEITVLPDPETHLNGGTAALIAAIAALIFLGAAVMQLGAEAHFSAQGWTRDRPWQLWRMLWAQRLGRARATSTTPLSDIGGTCGRW